MKKVYVVYELDKDGEIDYESDEMEMFQTEEEAEAFCKQFKSDNVEIVEEDCEDDLWEELGAK